MILIGNSITIASKSTNTAHNVRKIVRITADSKFRC